MGTRVVGVAEHHIAAALRATPHNLSAILTAATQACTEVDRYWSGLDPQPLTVTRADSWRTIQRGDDDTVTEWWFGGPGGFSIHFRPHVAEIHAGARWRGFLTIAELRHVHLIAFKEIARAVGSSAIVFVPCYAEELFEAAANGSTLEECVQLLERNWGTGQNTLNRIDPRVIRECDRTPPKVWYIESTVQP